MCVLELHHISPSNRRLYNIRSKCEFNLEHDNLGKKLSYGNLVEDTSIFAQTYELDPPAEEDFCAGGKSIFGGFYPHFI